MMTTTISVTALPLVFLQHSLTMFATDTIHATPLSRHKSPLRCSFVANGATSCDSPKPIAVPLTQDTSLPAPTPYQISSYNSLEIDESDPEEWFEQANRHPTATLSIDCTSRMSPTTHQKLTSQLILHSSKQSWTRRMKLGTLDINTRQFHKV